MNNHTTKILQKLRSHWINKKKPEIGDLNGDKFSDLYNDFINAHNTFTFTSDKSIDRQLLENFNKTASSNVLKVYFEFCDIHSILYKKPKPIETGIRTFE